MKVWSCTNQSWRVDGSVSQDDLCQHARLLSSAKECGIARKGSQGIMTDKAMHQAKPKDNKKKGREGSEKLEDKADDNETETQRRWTRLYMEAHKERTAFTGCLMMAIERVRSRFCQGRINAIPELRDVLWTALDITG